MTKNQISPSKLPSISTRPKQLCSLLSGTAVALVAGRGSETRNLKGVIHEQAKSIFRNFNSFFQYEWACLPAPAHPNARSIAGHRIFYCHSLGNRSGAIFKFSLEHLWGNHGYNFQECPVAKKQVGILRFHRRRQPLIF